MCNMRADFLCGLSVFSACCTSALIIPTPPFLTAGRVRLPFTKEATDPIGADFTLVAPSNGTQIAKNVDLSLGFVDVDLNFPSGSYRILAFNNDTTDLSTPSTLQSTGDFNLIDPTPNDPISTASASTPTSSAPPSPSSSSPNASPSSSASSNSAVAAKSQPSTGVIVAVVICVLVILAGLLFLCLFLRRRKQQRRNSHSRDTLDSPPQMAPSSLTMTTGTYPYSHVEPFTSPVSASTSLSSPQQRQQYITNEMRLVRKRMEELRHTTNSTSASSSTPESCVSSPSQISALSTSADATSADATSADLERSRQQNDELQAQIAQLEAQLQSAWALGLSNDPPPGYVA
ncbi:hypothetical protein DFH09DRAFT_1364611 [Mycena vulgaris]|nr:hypothetical protein DFH09DRAFT_1364611 [Mycena vulgaris]